MRIEIIVLAALAALASAAPQWPYRDAVAPYYYGYPGKTPYMYRSGDEDDERDETYSVARQDLKVANNDGGSTVTVVEDDEKADGVQVVETGSAKPLKPVAQSANNNQQQQDQQQPAAASQAQQPLSTNNANNAQQQQQTANSGQPLTVQQPGQQPPQAFPPARPAARPPRPSEDEDEDEEDDESEEDDEDAEDDEDDGDDDDDDDDEEDEEDRRRDNIAQKEPSSDSEEPAQQSSVQEEPQASVATSEGSDEVAQEEQPVVAAEQAKPTPIPSQTAVLSNKVNKNKQSAAAVASVPVAKNKNKNKPVASKGKPSSGAIEALVPGYVTDQGEVLVPVDTVTGSQPITIVPDPFSPPSRIVSGPRPIPQSAVPNTPSRQVPYWYRNSPVVNPLTDEPAPRQTLYTPVPPPGSIFTFDDDDDDDEDDLDDSPAIIPGNRLRQDAEDDDEEEEDEDEEDDRKKKAQQPQKVPLAAVPAVGNSGEDDEAEALAFVNSGRPVANKKPPTASSGAPSGGSGNKKPGKPGSSNESDSEEDLDSEEEDDVSNEEDEEEDDAARAQIAANPLNRGRNYVDEELVSFPPSRSPTVFAVIQGKYPGSVSQRQQSQIISASSPGNPYQRFVVRVTPANRPGRPTPVYYRPVESRPPNRRVVPVASFDVSVEDTRPPVDSDEDSVSIGGPSPGPSYPFVYKVQGSLSSLRFPSGGPGPQALAALLGGGPQRPSLGYYGAAFSSGSSGLRPPRPGPYGYGPRPGYSFSVSGHGSPYGPRPSPSFSYGPSRPSPSFSYEPRPHSFSQGPRRPSHGPPRPSGGPPVIVRRKQPGGGPDRPPKPQYIAVYNPTGSSSPGPREPVDEEYYTFEVPEHNSKIVPSGGPSKNKRPTVHRRPTPVIHQKFESQQDEESSEEVSPVQSPPQQVQIIPQGSVRRRIRGGKQLKPKKNSKKTVSTKKQQQQDQQDPLGILSKINKSKTKMH